MIVDASAIRVQCAARLIAYYCSKGKPCYFIRPLWDSPLFQCYWGICEKPETIWDRQLTRAMFSSWYSDVALFNPYPGVMLFRKHTLQEQTQILSTLRDTYDFRL